MKISSRGEHVCVYGLRVQA